MIYSYYPDVIFTAEEENLLCFFPLDSRKELIADMEAVLSEYDEPELLVLAESCLSKLQALSDAEYLALVLVPTYNLPDKEV